MGIFPKQTHNFSLQNQKNKNNQLMKNFEFNKCLHECKNVPNSKAQFLAERNLRSTQDFYIYMVIYKPF